MQRLLYVLMFGMLLALPVGAADENQICQRTGTTVITIQRNTNGTVVDTENNSWSVKFDYDMFAGARGDGNNVIKGITACNDIDTKSNAAGTSGTVTGLAPGDANTFLRVSDADSGLNCWCRMVSVLSSYWVFVKSYETADACAGQCTTYCANAFANNSEIGTDGRRLRWAMFDSMW